MMLQTPRNPEASPGEGCSKHSLWQRLQEPTKRDDYAGTTSASGYHRAVGRLDGESRTRVKRQFSGLERGAAMTAPLDNTKPCIEWTTRTKPILTSVDILRGRHKSWQRRPAGCNLDDRDRRQLRFKRAVESRLEQGRRRHTSFMEGACGKRAAYERLKVRGGGASVCITTADRADASVSASPRATWVLDLLHDLLRHENVFDVDLLLAVAREHLHLVTCCGRRRVRPQ